MVQRSAVAVLHDTSHVCLPSLGGINGDGEWTTGGDEGLHGGFGVLDILVAGDLDGNLFELGLVAGSGTSHSGGVWVLGFGVNTAILNNPFEGVVHESSLASVVSVVGALDEFFLGEGLEVLGGQVVLTFHVSGGGERPAGSALSLVLDVGDGSVLSPILGTSGGLDLSGADLQVVEGLVGWHSQVVVVLELVGAKVSELVDSEEGVIGFGVELVIHVEVLLEAFKGVGFLLV